MFKEVKKYNYRIIHPKLVALISSIDDNNRANICTVAWIMPVSIDPPLVAVALQTRHKTTHNILKTKEFVVNIPQIQQKEIVKKCGSISGWEVDKISKFHIKLEDSKKISTPRVSNSVAYLECQLHAYFEAGDHYIITGKIIHAEADSRYFKNMWEDEPPLLFHFGSDIYGIIKRL
ncbi:MAG: hypothetical protein DRQ03_01345 [Candidatus Hydrothermota bacterium]|nr:MAG: hypothetical protein DRQ03_01345 [Candidatus Hydrothermae bacterium]